MTYDEDAKSFTSFELKRLYLFYRFHDSGLGKRLMEDVLSFAKDMKSETIWLQVHEANNHTIEFYRRFGFVQTGADLYRAGRGAYRVLTMVLTVKLQRAWCQYCLKSRLNTQTGQRGLTEAMEGCVARLNLVFL